MQIVLDLVAVFLAYVIGSIPFGLVIVKLKTGKDIREVESGRTGGTNALRAAGFWAGIGTALLDILKGAVAVWLARWISPEQAWLHVIAPLAAIIGHNYSIFLAERDANGKFRLRGGAGGAPSVGGAWGLFPASILIILPLGVLVSLPSALPRSQPWRWHSSPSSSLRSMPRKMCCPGGMCYTEWARNCC